jgi:hypothetical protein
MKNIDPSLSAQAPAGRPNGAEKILFFDPVGQVSTVYEHTHKMVPKPSGACRECITLLHSTRSSSTVLLYDLQGGHRYTEIAELTNRLRTHM